MPKKSILSLTQPSELRGLFARNTEEHIEMHHGYIFHKIQTLGNSACQKAQIPTKKNGKKTTGMERNYNRLREI